MRDHCHSAEASDSQLHWVILLQQSRITVCCILPRDELVDDVWCPQECMGFIDDGSVMPYMWVKRYKIGPYRCHLDWVFLIYGLERMFEMFNVASL